MRVRHLALAVAVSGLAFSASGCPDENVTGTSDACPPGFVCTPLSDADAGGGDSVNETIDDTKPDDGTPDVTGDTPADIGGDIEPGTFGAPCVGNADCLSGWCIEGEQGPICTKQCTLECPNGFDCKAVLTGGADVVTLCVPRVKKLCFPCAEDFQCTGGACLTIDGEKQCAYECSSDEDCPGGYSCGADPSGERPGDWCVPVTGSCSCNEDLDGAQRTCFAENDLGSCYGVETCDATSGWGGCTAVAPSEEICDGKDNDCDALIDEGVEDGGACTVDNEFGSCAGVEVCLGTQGYVCQAATPEAEACDFKDNDCDGLVDEDYKDASGEFTLTAHCGTCNNDCTTKIPNGVGTCDLAGATPICVVDSCNEDYVKINDFQCSLPPDVSCQPCTDDGDCYGGSCIQLDGQSVCVSPCGAAAGSCQDGYACEDIGGGVERCVPLTDSCVCSQATDGQTRTCKLSNASGTCFGEETCVADVGWQGCTALTPAAEQCNGVDDNCNGAVDDNITPPTDPCESTNAFGTCTGSWFCSDPDGSSGIQWWCSAKTPADDVCDYQDNDCDGVADQPFKNANGKYVDLDNCGACGVSCVGAIPNATAMCAANGGNPRCEVEACETGFYQAGPLTCLPLEDALCSPCQNDSNCQTPGDKCVAIDGGNYCARSCAADNLYGVPEGTCPPDYTCTDMPDGSKQCLPDTGSCTCTPTTLGNTRTCVDTNGFGTCFGTETCAADGWGGCTATTPAAETCDAVDNDCNAVVDDVEGRGDACDITNGFGTCVGIQDCVSGQTDLQCVGQTPAAETCDYADNNCDGTVDEGFSELYTSCSAGDGICKRFGFYECTADGSGTQCNAVAAPAQAEICDGLDNDCNGVVDDGFTDLGDVCTVGQGICQNTGVKICNVAGDATICSATPNPSTGESCNNLDDDCDGLTDETFGNKNTVCVAGQGVCANAGVYVCSADGSGTECSATPGTGGNEVCDGLDNDCDGTVDNNLGTAPNCAEQDGVCAGSKQTCGGALGWRPCTGPEYGGSWEQTELTCDGLDNDCDGTADNNLPTVPCPNQTGVCAGSVAPCNGPSGLGTCGAAEYGPNYQATENLCDLLDNDCDGQVDEGYKNQTTGKYTTAQACGNCFTDCTQIYDLPNAFGTCNGGGTPTCQLNCDSGYFNLNGIPDDGCEFQLDITAIYVSVTDPAAANDSGCGLGPVGTGSGYHPCASIAQGLSRASSTGRSKVFVAGGSYAEVVTMVNGKNLRGGFNPTTWQWDPSVNLTLIAPAGGSGHQKAVVAVGITGATTLEGFVIFAPNATTAGLNSYGVYIRASDNSLHVQDNVIYAGDGAPGTRGGNGGDGLDGTDGSPGLVAYEPPSGSGGGATCSISRAGGAAGQRSCGGTNVRGGKGGDAVCAPIFDTKSSGQNGQSGANGGGSGGGGGWDGRTQSSSSCNLCNLPTSPNTMTGKNGANGNDGNDGNGGNGCSSSGGTIAGNEWVAVGGGNGGNGGHGGGGGGGGAGGGGDGDSTCWDDLGGTGGGGGSGACGGTNGAGGSGGGGSFGVFIYNCASAPVVTGNTIHRGNGGKGGDGGNGGGGGVGGDGANGGEAATGTYDFCTGDAGKGGQGGDGGHGGGGGGGCGGVSYGVYAVSYGGGSPGYNTNNTFPAGGSGGQGGVGGTSLGNNGSNGSNGAAGNAQF